MPERHPQIDEALERARALLRANLTPAGVLAATPGEQAEARAYTRVFARDAAICAFGMVLSQDPALVRGAADSLRTLAAHQAENGQIPKYVDAAGTEPDFWYVGCIDAALWWLLALRFVVERTGDSALAEELAEPARGALRWLHCQEHPRLFLLQQNEASDWADIMPRSGFVLYSNALWYRVKCLYGLPHAQETAYHFDHLFWPFSRELPDYRRLRLLTHYVRQQGRRSDLYLSFVNFSFWGGEGDVFGNLLAVLLGPTRHGPATRILDALERRTGTQPWPARAVCEPIGRDDPLWRPYMDRHRQNLPWQYHNGGCWPFIGGFWVVALAAAGRSAEAQAAFGQLVEVNAVRGWEFNEWFHGQTGEPRGMPGQSWNAAMLIAADHALKGERLFWR